MIFCKNYEILLTFLTSIKIKAKCIHHDDIIIKFTMRKQNVYIHVLDSKVLFPYNEFPFTLKTNTYDSTPFFTQARPFKIS